MLLQIVFAARYVQISEKRLVRGLVKFVTALACLFCLALLGTCLVESAYLISEPCIYWYTVVREFMSDFILFFTHFSNLSGRVRARNLQGARGVHVPPRLDWAGM